MFTNPPALNISAFGEFSISLAEPHNSKCSRISDAQSRSKKTWALIEYLIFSQKKEVPVSELVDLLWPDGYVEDPIASLRLVVYRARNELSQLDGISGSKLIVNIGESYGWNPNIKVTYDTVSFETLCSSAANARSKEDKIQFLLQAVSLYRGHFIPKSHYIHWVVSRDTYYHNKYISACTQAVQLLSEAERYQEIIELCTHAVQLEPYNEDLNAALISALNATGSTTAALKHYSHISNLLLNDYGIPSTEKLSTVYRSISRNGDIREINLEAIRSDLMESDDDLNGAFFCGYEVFRQLYYLKARENLRSGQSVYLALLTLFPAANHTPTDRSKVLYMEKLKNAIQGSLRLGDVFTQYSSAQYLVLLQSTDRENGLKILDRISASLHRSSSSRVNFLLQSSLLPILPSNHPAPSNSDWVSP